MNKTRIISYSNKKSQLIRKSIKNILKKNKFHQKNLIIIIGGDGFMLKNLKKNLKPNNIFYGVNSGNYGFLMNKFNEKKFLRNLIKSKKISISALEMLVEKNTGKIKKALAINEVSIYRQSRQAAILEIKKNNSYIIKKLIGDGVIISTPAGSTAYNLSVHGPILDLNSRKLSLVPISPFRPRRWKGKIMDDNAKIVVKNLDTKKRPISAVADNQEVRNAKVVKISINKKIRFNILFNSNNSLQKKIKIEQLKKEIF